jgi:hypothetical protein
MSLLIWKKVQRFRKSEISILQSLIKISAQNYAHGVSSNSLTQLSALGFSSESENKSFGKSESLQKQKANGDDYPGKNSMLRPSHQITTLGIVFSSFRI